MEGIWASRPRDRLAAIRAPGATERTALVDRLIQHAPTGHWPFGMPTVVNPLLVVVGVSPGNSPTVGGDIWADDADPPPTFGEPHPGFFVADTSGYWAKIRELCKVVVRGWDASLSDDECYALSGHFNLGTGRFGREGGQSSRDRSRLGGAPRRTRVSYLDGLSCSSDSSYTPERSPSLFRSAAHLRRDRMPALRPRAVAITAISDANRSLRFPEPIAIAHRAEPNASDANHQRAGHPGSDRRPGRGSPGTRIPLAD